MLRTANILLKYLLLLVDVVKKDELVGEDIFGETLNILAKS